MRQNGPMVTRIGRDRPLVVLQSFREPRPTSNPYLSQLVGALRRRAVVRTFSWPRALFGRYDIFHLHWPELLLVKSSGLKTVLSNVLFLTLLLRIRHGHPVLVRTVHNLTPHEKRAPLIMRSLQRADDATSAFICMTDDVTQQCGIQHTTIPHGHYIDWFSDRARAEPVEGRFLFFGLIRTYKGVDALIDAFSGLQGKSLSLRVVGSPDPKSLGRDLEQRAVSDDRISVDLRYIEDEVLVEEITRSQLVVLPYTEMMNSGALLLALSLNRPVLVPANNVTKALALEVGPGWVQLYEGVLSSSALEEALHASSAGAGSPDLSARTWTHIADAHLTAFLTARG